MTTQQNSANNEAFNLDWVDDAIRNASWEDLHLAIARHAEARQKVETKHNKAKWLPTERRMLEFLMRYPSFKFADYVWELRLRHPIMYFLWYKWWLRSITPKELHRYLDQPDLYSQKSYAALPEMILAHPVLCCLWLLLRLPFQFVINSLSFRRKVVQSSNGYSDAINNLFVKHEFTPENREIPTDSSNSLVGSGIESRRKDFLE